MNDSSYRRGFWSQTLNRFFALEEFSREYPQSQILHVEADVILFPNFPLADFNGLSKGIAFPLSNESVGVASTFWFNSYQDIHFFCEYLRAERQVSPDLIDTSALGLFSTRYKERVTRLRSGLDSIDTYRPALDGSLLCGDAIPLNSNGIFDASTLGIYLCGTDPRNTFGVSTLFSELSHHRINPKSLEFKVQNSIIFALHGKEMRPIYSLHNHSKDSRIFKSDSAVYLSNRWEHANHQTIVRYSLNGFLGFCIDYLHLIRSKLFQLLRKAIR